MKDAATLLAESLTPKQRDVILKLSRRRRRAIDFCGSTAAALRLPTSKRPALTDRDMTRDHGRRTAWYFLNATGEEVASALRAHAAIAGEG